MGKVYGKRPSEIAGIGNSWAAYQFDSAVLVVGVDAEQDALDEARAAGSSGRSSDGGPPKVPKREKDLRGMSGWRELAGGNIKKKQIPESGIW